MNVLLSKSVSGDRGSYSKKIGVTEGSYCLTEGGSKSAVTPGGKSNHYGVILRSYSNLTRGLSVFGFQRLITNKRQTIGGTSKSREQIIRNQIIWIHT